MGFNEFGLSEPVLQGVKAMGFVQPTPIQVRTIPLLLAGSDVIGSSQTGTGKTAAFALPILSRLDKHQSRPRVLILEPTRELAAQVETAFRDFSRFTDLQTVLLLGGVGYGRQREALRRGPDIIIATPGRLLDHVQQGTCKLNSIQVAVLDEADRMLDMGFLPDVRRILEFCPRNRLTALFSATIPPEVDSLIQWAMKSPETIEVGLRRSPAETVKHVIFPVAEAQKVDLLLELLRQVDYNSVIVFCRTKKRADQIGHMLRRKQHPVAILHSNRTQREREQALRGFRAGKFEVLVATDIAARGLDILTVSHVINFDVPQHPEDYVHRIGRTGRAEAAGDAFTLMVAEDRGHVDAIERFIGRAVERTRLEGFPYQYTSLFDDEKQKRGATPSRRRVLGGRVSGGYHFGLGVRRRK